MPRTGTGKTKCITKELMPDSMKVRQLTAVIR